MAGAPDALQERSDRMRRAELAHEVHVADVDAQLERACRHHCTNLSRLESALGVQTMRTRKAAVVCGHLLFAEKLSEVSGDALRELSCIDEHQGRPMRLDQRRQLCVDLLEDLVGHHRFERRSGQLHRHIHVTLMPHIDDSADALRTRLAAGPHQEASDVFDRVLRCG